MTPDQLARFLAVVDDSPNERGRRLARSAVFTGFRLTEILCLRRDDIDLPAGRIRATNVKHRSKRQRWLGIPAAIHEDLAWFYHGSDADLPLKVCHPDTLGHWIKIWLSVAGLGRFRPHDLRHTFSTLALQSGVPLRTLQRWLDHSDTSVTEIYAHDIDIQSPIEITISQTKRA